MEKIIHLAAFSIIGKEGSTKEGKVFIQRLVKEATEHFADVKDLGTKLSDGNYAGFWGAMSDFSHSLAPWENNFSEGLYLYGLQCPIDAKAPKGWIKWNIPARDYFEKEVTMDTYQKTFFAMVQYYIPVEGYKLAGAAFDFNDPKTGKLYIYFPIEKDPLIPHEEELIAKIAPCGLHCGYCFFKECDGCLSCNNKCSYGYYQEDKICPNIKCSKSKGLSGCYECKDLENCEFGFYALKPGNAKASAMFIKKHGKKAFEEATKALLGKEKPYYTIMVEAGDENAQIKLLEKALGIEQSSMIYSI